ncbi:MAG: twin-arginine translocase TatA/TatE family subunit [Acidaminococcaceae bacterium]|nr:twin-arginine translocase TatA/TatE family subunit [Acidaminococcaceae bacterium]
MGRIGTTELLVILLIALVLFGGSRVAGLGKALGTSLREFRAELNKGAEKENEPAGTAVAEK